MLVEAIQPCTYDDVLYQPGLGEKSQFRLHPVSVPEIDPKTHKPVTVDGVLKTRVKTVEEQFSPRAMKKVETQVKAAPKAAVPPPVKPEAAPPVPPVPAPKTAEKEPAKKADAESKK